MISTLSRTRSLASLWSRLTSPRASDASSHAEPPMDDEQRCPNDLYRRPSQLQDGEGDRSRGIRVGEFEQQQLRAIRDELNELTPGVLRRP